MNQDIDEDTEEDIREVDQRDTDAMFLCPYTRTRMEVPMKKYFFLLPRT